MEVSPRRKQSELATDKSAEFKGIGFHQRNSQKLANCQPSSIGTDSSWAKDINVKTGRQASCKEGSKEAPYNRLKLRKN